MLSVVCCQLSVGKRRKDKGLIKLGAVHHPLRRSGTQRQPLRKPRCCLLAEGLIIYRESVSPDSL